jgi:superfamily I DNA and/or RNA helicase
MQSHTTLPLTLEQGLAKHPNVDYRAKQIIEPLIAKETYRIIPTEKVHSYLDKLLDNRFKITRYFPNIFTLRSSVGAILEREGYDYRIGMFKKREPEAYNTLLAKINKKLSEIEQHRSLERDKEIELTELLANFKEATNISFDKNDSKKWRY